MPLQMASELKFPMGTRTPINEDAFDRFLTLISNVVTSQATIEVFKKGFCRVSGDYYARSSSIEWAQADLASQARNAAEDAPNFIAAIYEAFEVLGNQGVTVPDTQHINQILYEHQQQYEIIDGQLVETNGSVVAPNIDESESVSTTVRRALADAKALIGTEDASSAIDRVHTALHGYLVQLCHDSAIEIPTNPTVSKAFKSLRSSHPALQASGQSAQEVTRVLNSFAASIDAFSTLRNHASLAHVNELLDTPEANAIVNAMYTIFRYIQDSIHRHG